MRRATPKPCIGPMASRVLRTIRSSVPCRMSDLFSSTGSAPVGWIEEYSFSSIRPTGRKVPKNLGCLKCLRVPKVPRGLSRRAGEVGGDGCFFLGRQPGCNGAHDLGRLRAAAGIFVEQLQLLEQ